MLFWTIICIINNPAEFYIIVVFYLLKNFINKIKTLGFSTSFVQNVWSSRFFLPHFSYFKFLAIYVKMPVTNYVLIIFFDWIFDT